MVMMRVILIISLLCCVVYFASSSSSSLSPSSSEMVAGVQVISGAGSVEFEGFTYRILDCEGIVHLSLEKGFIHHHELVVDLVPFAPSLEGLQFSNESGASIDLNGLYRFSHRRDVGTVRFSEAAVNKLNAGGRLVFIDYYRL